ncbi:hypothetical protein E2C01_090052 [Portunus trituberculatus]|nr:hypothetical protein [Portunus trituberculatus]
MSRAEVK